jgi:hypothetical protein
VQAHILEIDMVNPLEEIEECVNVGNTLSS